MNLLVTLDERYVNPLRIMLESLFAHEKHTMDIYLFYSDISQKKINGLKRYIKSQGNQLIPIHISGKEFQDAPVFRYFTKEMYYRLLCSELIPDTEERILYLDPDLLIRDEIYPLYQMDFEGKQLIGVEDYAIKHMLQDKKKAIGFSEEDIYINSGVLLFNLKKIREKFNLSEFINVIEQYRDVVSYPDQDAINLYFKNDIKVVQRKYNYNTGYGSAGGMLLYLLGLQKESEEPVIVHFMGKSKPWQVDYYGKYTFEYLGYLKKHLNRRGRLLFFFKPCYVAAKLGKAFIRKTFIHK